MKRDETCIYCSMGQGEIFPAAILKATKLDPVKSTVAKPKMINSQIIGKHS